MGKSIQRDIYYEKMKSKAETTGQALAVLMMASRFKKHQKYATTVLNNVNAALAAEPKEEEYAITRTC